MDASREMLLVRSFDTSIRRSWLGWCGSSNASWVARPRPVTPSNDWFGSVPISLHTGRSACAVRSSDGSRMKRELPVRFCERPVVKLHRPTRQENTRQGSSPRTRPQKMNQEPINNPPKVHLLVRPGLHLPAPAEHRATLARGRGDHRHGCCSRSCFLAAAIVAREGRDPRLPARRGSVARPMLAAR